MSEASFTSAILAIEAAVIVIGFIGNVISIIVFSRKTLRNNSISTYCTSLAIVDCLTLIHLTNIIYYFIYNVYLNDQNSPFCAIAHTTIIYISGIPPWIMIAFSLDKLLSMRTSSISVIKKKWFQWSIVVAISLFHIGLYIYFPILIKLSEIFPGFFICDVFSIGFFNIHMILFLLETCLIPFVILTITSILTIRVLIKSRNVAMKAGQVSQGRKSRDRKFAFSSLTLNTIFIVLKLPSFIFFILSSFFSYFDVYFYNISILFFFVNTSMGFFVHLVTNSLFRREFFVLFRLVKGNGESSIKTNATNRPIRFNQVSTT